MTIRTATGLFQLWHKLLELVRTRAHISECHTQLPLASGATVVRGQKYSRSSHGL